MNPDREPIDPPEVDRPEQEEVSCPSCQQQIVLDLRDGLAHDIVCPHCGAEFSATPIDLLENVPKEFRELEAEAAEAEAVAAAAAAAKAEEAEANSLRRQRLLIEISRRNRTYRYLAVAVLISGLASALLFLVAGVMQLIAAISVNHLQTEALAHGLSTVATALAMVAITAGLGGSVLNKRGH